VNFNSFGDFVIPRFGPSAVQRLRLRPALGAWSGLRRSWLRNSGGQLTAAGAFSCTAGDPASARGATAKPRARDQAISACWGVQPTLCATALSFPQFRAPVFPERRDQVAACTAEPCARAQLTIAARWLKGDSSSCSSAGEGSPAAASASRCVTPQLATPTPAQSPSACASSRRSYACSRSAFGANGECRTTNGFSIPLPSASSDRPTAPRRSEKAAGGSFVVTRTCFPSPLALTARPTSRSVP